MRSDCQKYFAWGSKKWPKSVYCYLNSTFIVILNKKNHKSQTKSSAKTSYPMSRPAMSHIIFVFATIVANK